MLGARCSNIHCQNVNQSKPFGPTSSKFSKTCSTDLRTCPMGHEVKVCESGPGYYCSQCEDGTFQPNENGVNDRCRLKKACNLEFMRYKHPGSRIKDAKCECIPGYHFESTDQRACVPSRPCDRGFGQTEYGACERCKAGMFSDKRSAEDKCRPVTNCEKSNRCTIHKSNGTFDNVCSKQKVKDISTCGKPLPPHSGLEHTPHQVSIPLIAGAVLGAIAIIVLILFLILFILWKRRKVQTREDPLTKEQFESLVTRIIDRSEGDEPYSRKVITASFREIEDRIDRQIWTLAQELFRDHMQPAMYEVVVEKYKDKDHKYAINGYLQDWREWKGENSAAISHLFTCLRQVGRVDIVYEICNKFREGYPELVVDAETQLENGVVKKRSHKISFGEHVKETLCPCTTNRNKYMKDNEESKETKASLLSPDAKAKEAGFSDTEPVKVIDEHDDVQGEADDSVSNLNPQDAGSIYRSRPCPSAPVIDDVGNIHVVIPMTRAMSFPVQASS